MAQHGSWHFCSCSTPPVTPERGSVSITGHAVSLCFKHKGVRGRKNTGPREPNLDRVVGSGRHFDRRIALGGSGAAAFGPPWRPAAGFWRVGGRAERY